MAGYVDPAALASLDEAGKSLITLHLLDVPATLNRSLLSTSAIENVVRNYRAQTAKVARWRAETSWFPSILHIAAFG